MERLRIKNIVNDLPDEHEANIQRLYTWLKKLDIEYQAYIRYLEFLKQGKNSPQSFFFREAINDPKNMTCYLCALKAFQQKNKDLDTENLINKWITLSNEETEECIFEGQKLRCVLEARYKSMHAEQLIEASPDLFGVQHTSLAQSMLSKSQNNFIFDLEKVLEVIDLEEPAVEDEVTPTTTTTSDDE